MAANAVTLESLLHITAAEWRELLPQVGARAALSKAASELSSGGTNGSGGGSVVAEQVMRLRSESAKVNSQIDSARKMNMRCVVALPMVSATLLLLGGLNGLLTDEHVLARTCQLA